MLTNKAGQPAIPERLAALPRSQVLSHGKNLIVSLISKSSLPKERNIDWHMPIFGIGLNIGLRLASGWELYEAIPYLILGTDMDNAISVNIKGDFNLGETPGGRGNPSQFKLTEHLVVSCHLTLSLEDLDTNLGLVVCSCAECLCLLSGDSCVPATGRRRQSTILGVQQ